MFKIVEKVYDEPIRFPVKPGVWFEPGMVVKVVDFNGDLVVDACDGYDAFGVVGTEILVPYCSKAKLDPKYMVEVWTQRMAFRTDKYDFRFNLDIGDPLFAGCDGFLTCKKPFEQAHIIGRVVSPPRDLENSYFEAVWL